MLRRQQQRNLVSAFLGAVWFVTLQNLNTLAQSRFFKSALVPRALLGEARDSCPPSEIYNVSIGVFSVSPSQSFLRVVPEMNINRFHALGSLSTRPVTTKSASSVDSTEKGKWITLAFEVRHPFADFSLDLLLNSPTALRVQVRKTMEQR